VDHECEDIRTDRQTDRMASYPQSRYKGQVQNIRPYLQTAHLWCKALSYA